MRWLTWLGHLLNITLIRCPNPGKWPTHHMPQWSWSREQLMPRGSGCHRQRGVDSDRTAAGPPDWSHTRGDLRVCSAQCRPHWAARNVHDWRGPWGYDQDGSEVRYGTINIQCSQVLSMILYWWWSSIAWYSHWFNSWRVWVVWENITGCLNFLPFLE